MMTDKMLKNSIIAAALGCLASTGAAFADKPQAQGKALEQPQVQVEPLLQTMTTSSGDPIKVPRGALQTVASKYHIPAGASLSIHKHPYPRFGYMLSGCLIVTNTQTHQSREFKAGDVIVEDIDMWHQARNPGDTTVDLLVIDLMQPMAKNVILQP